MTDPRGLSRGAEPEMTLKMTRERLNEKIQSDPDLETEAGILHPEAPRADFRTALDLFGDAKFALGAWSGAHAAHGGKPYSELNDAANAAFDRVMEMVPPRGEAETPTDKRLLDMIEMRDKIIDKMRVERRLLAMLASDTPQFDNPIAAWNAQRIRDEILQETANAD